jgi:hypothetical protein
MNVLFTSAALFVALTTASAGAVAQEHENEVAIDITAAPAPPPLQAIQPLQLATPVTLDQALAGDPEFQAARRRRKAGILLTAIGTPLGLAFGAVGAFFWNECSDEHAPEHCSDTKNRVMAVAGYGVAGLSLLVGVPLIISGQVRMSRLRQEKRRELLPTAVSVAPLPGGAQLGATWRF